MIASIGAGMNQSEMLTRFVRETDLDVVMLAGRYTLLEQGALDELLPACARARRRPSSRRACSTPACCPRAPARRRHLRLRARARRAVARACTGSPTCSSRHGTSLPVAAAQFALAHPVVATVCLGARSAAQVERNAALFDVPVPDAAWAEFVHEGLLRPDAPTPAQAAS